MANIGTFTANDNGFTGTVRTLTLNVKVKFVPSDKGSEHAPDYRIQAAGGYDIGAAWKKVSQVGGSIDAAPVNVYSGPAHRLGNQTRSH